MIESSRIKTINFKVEGPNPKLIEFFFFNLIRKFSDKSVELDFCDNLDLDYIPSKDESVIISWKHNLNGGAEALSVDENDAFLTRVKDIAISAGKAININFASIDVALTNKKEVFVMEINSSVCMNKFSEIMPNGYEISKQIYSKAIDKMFE